MQDNRTGRRPPPWAWLGLLVPALVAFGTYSDSRFSPVGWIAAFGLLVAWLVLLARSSR
ncbi:MAG: hypothetical protein LWW86_11030 [Micrococcales bacterium]|nr:hypothetical protein [Micrococcales bacterium]